MNAGISGEDIQVSALTITDTVGDAADDASDIDNAELWADLTDANSSRGDVYETKVSDTKQPDDTDALTTVAETQAFTLTQTITVPKGSFIRVAFVADLVADATTGDTHTITIESGGVVAAVGAETGEDADITIDTDLEQTMTVAAAGTLTISKDSSSPLTDIVIGGKTATLAVFKLAETSKIEDLDVDDITFTITNGDKVDTLYFYEGDTLLTSRPGDTTVRIDLADGTLVIPADGNKKVTVKGKISTVDGAFVTNNIDIQVGLATENCVGTTGMSSGDGVDSSTTYAYGTAMDIYESRPYITLYEGTGAPTGGDLVANATQLLAIFNVEAEDTEEINFQKTDVGGIRFEISGLMADSAGTAPTFTLKDGDGNTLDTAVVSFSSATVPEYVDFDFNDNALNIPAGETKKLKVYGDLSLFEDTNDNIQVWLDDSDATYIDWSIEENGASYFDGDKILRGDILGPVFVTPYTGA